MLCGSIGLSTYTNTNQSVLTPRREYCFFFAPFALLSIARAARLVPNTATKVLTFSEGAHTIK